MNDSIERNGGLGDDTFDERFNLDGVDPFESHLEAEDGIPKMREYEFGQSIIAPMLVVPDGWQATPPDLIKCILSTCGRKPQMSTTSLPTCLHTR